METITINYHKSEDSSKYPCKKCVDKRTTIYFRLEFSQLRAYME